MNSAWRNTILQEFVPNVAKLTLISDPDYLLTEEKLVFALRERGFDILEFNNPIEFRYVYESKYRSVWDLGERTDLVVVLRVQDMELASLPYDLLQAGRQLSFSLGALFPNLSYPVLEQLDRSLLDALFNAQEKTVPKRMGDNETKDFILRNVFGIAEELISTEADLLQCLLKLHYGKAVIPPMLAERLIEVLDNTRHFDKWPLHELISDAEIFFAFIQERWPIFLANLNQSKQVQQNGPSSALKIDGPVNLPFGHQNVKVYIDNLFIEGILTPVNMPNFEIEKDSWILSGVVSVSKTETDDLRISRLFDRVDKIGVSVESRHTDWLSFAKIWAELSALIHKRHNRQHKQRLEETGDNLNTRFADWLDAHYGNLVNLPPTTPAMLHHVPRRLARDIEDHTTKHMALIVIDGLSLDQWVTVRDIIQRQNSNLILREFATFAWIPTLTSVSRQSIFSGKPPLYFQSSINSTNSEEKLWQQFWQQNGFSKFEVAYKRGLGDGNATAALDSLINPSQTKIVGLVIDKVDKIMHGMQLGSAGMHNQITQWCSSEYLITVLNYLIGHGFDVWITSDHGNIEAVGRGHPSEGAIAESRGERVRIYPTPELRSRISSSFSFAREWQSSWLPDDYFPLVTTGRDAFVNKRKLVVSHGGIALEEVIVPLIKIEKKAQSNHE